jgi:hypothetical protein
MAEAIDSIAPAETGSADLYAGLTSSQVVELPR